eukprot:m.151126 g.151126  ORF g.151126 m.151126 type:complete len:121 (-) comp16192_c0_seq2:1356-1718(-)
MRSSRLKSCPTNALLPPLAWASKPWRRRRRLAPVLLPSLSPTLTQYQLSRQYTSGVYFTFTSCDPVITYDCGFPAPASAPAPCVPVLSTASCPTCLPALLLDLVLRSSLSRLDFPFFEQT